MSDTGLGRGSLRVLFSSLASPKPAMHRGPGDEGTRDFQARPQQQLRLQLDAGCREGRRIWGSQNKAVGTAQEAGVCAAR